VKWKRLVEKLVGDPRGRPDVPLLGDPPADELLALLRRAGASAGMGDGATAARAASEIYRIKSKNVEAIRTLRDRSALDEAITCYEAIVSVELDPQTAYRAWNDLAYCHSLSGDIETAAEYYGRAFRIRPNMPADDEDFQRHYDLGLAKTQTWESGRRRPRFFNLLRLFERALPLDGDIAECGCWRGLSSYLMCRRLQIADSEFTGLGYHIFDSFHGLARPGREDSVSPSVEGKFAVTLHEVRENLREFPDIEFHPGWIPETFPGLPERRYRFIHVDVDLFEPTRSSLEYFLPRLVSGGVIVCDDYNWAGAKRAVDEVTHAAGIEIHVTGTNQAWLTKS
jgi:tetratricopeptide (TPR) repeat protein